MGGNSIISNKKTTYQTSPTHTLPRVGWDVNRFESLIQNEGYDALIDRALRCPCCDRNNGQALSTCKNCGGKGWFFVDRTQTRIVAQHMDSKKRFAEWGETQHGTASFTVYGIDKLGFMDKIILTQLEEFYTETLIPFRKDEKIIAYPLYEPLKVTNVYMFIDENEALKPLTGEDYTVNGNVIEFNADLLDDVKTVLDLNSKELPLQISIRYSHFPVYHVIDLNRELTRVREGKLCGYDDERLRAIPINVLARKAHYLNNTVRDGQLIDNSVVPGAERTKY